MNMGVLSPVPVLAALIFLFLCESLKVIKLYEDCQVKCWQTDEGQLLPSSELAMF